MSEGKSTILVRVVNRDHFADSLHSITQHYTLDIESGESAGVYVEKKTDFIFNIFYFIFARARARCLTS